MPPDPTPTQEEADDFKEASVGIIVAPVNTFTPSISGTAAVGAVLSCNRGIWTGDPFSFAYQWKRDGTTNIGTGVASYTTVAGDSTHSITCVVTATNHHGVTVANPSNAIAIP